MLVKYDNKRISIIGKKIVVPKPVVIRVNDIDEDMTGFFFDDFQKALDTGQNIIPIVIDSYGGDVYALFAMIDCIKNSPVPVMTICNGKACSAGGILLTCGHEGYRYATPNSTIMLHDGSTWFEGKVEDMKTSMKEMNRINALVYKIIDENCGQKSGFFKDKIKKLKNVDYWISPDRAFEYNMINHIGVPDLTYDVECKFKLNVKENDIGVDNNM